VGYVRVAFDDADYEAVPEHSAFAPALATAREVFHNDSPATAIHERVAPEPGDIIVRKTRFGAFSTTDQAHVITVAQLDGLPSGTDERST
jgi:hypothetical protein